MSNEVINEIVETFMKYNKLGLARLVYWELFNRKRLLYFYELVERGYAILLAYEKAKDYHYE